MEKAKAGKAGVSSFSGGVDSFYTLMQRLPSSGRLPEFCVKYVLFVHGFDIPLRNEESFWQAERTFSEGLAPLSVEMIPCQTNLHAFTAGLIPWGMAHGSALISPAMVLSGLVGRFFVPSSYAYQRLRPWGSSPLTDHMLSTERLEVVHDGASKGRLQKVEAISGWAPAQNYLRVCTNVKKRYGVRNCSRCEKCLRTMDYAQSGRDTTEFQDFQTAF